MFSTRVPFFSEIPLFVTNSTSTSNGGGSYTLSAIVSGTIPADAFIIMQWGTDPNFGPWNSSPGDAATIGTYSYTFSGIPASTTIYWRTIVLTPPAVVQFQTSNSQFTT